MLILMIHEEIAAQLVQLGQHDEFLSEQLNAFRRSKMEEFQGKVSDPAKQAEILVRKRVNHLTRVRKENTVFLKQVIKQIGGFPTAVEVGPLACLEALRILAHSHDEKFKQKQIKQLAKLDPAHISEGEMNFVLKLTNSSNKKPKTVSTTTVNEVIESSSRSSRSGFEIIATRRVFNNGSQEVA